MSTVSALRSAQAPAAPAATKPDFSGVEAHKDRWGYRTLQYTVAKGDTLTKIGNRIGSDADSLAQTNSLKNPDLIRVGQKLALPTTFHVVKKGETYWSIAQQYGISAKALEGLNETPATKLQVGQDVRVPAIAFTPAQKATRAALIAEVKAGAKGEQKVYFGEKALYGDYVRGNEMGYWGPVESGQHFEFTNDFKTVRVSDASDVSRTYKLQEPARDLRRVMVAQQLEGIGRAQVEKLGRGWVSKATIQPGKDGGVLLTIRARSGQDGFSVEWNERTGATFHGVFGTGPKRLPVTSAADAGEAIGKRLGLKMPLYGDLF